LEPKFLPEHSWSNSPATSSYPDLQRRTGNSPLPQWLRVWWPALVWACVIFTMSTDTFSAEHTGWVLEPVFRWLFPALTAGQFDLIHFCIRKSAHFTEYFIFAVLLYRSVRGWHQGWRWSWGLIALSIAAVYSALDEIHQAFVASRHASAYDSLLDSFGAFVAIAVLWVWFRTRKPALPAASSAD
jgi:VanZ family protein